MILVKNTIPAVPAAVVLIAARSASRIEVVLNEMNAAIWAEGRDRGKFTIGQALWPAGEMTACCVQEDGGEIR